jgi:hypothetical protein
MFALDSLTWKSLPWALTWQKVASEGHDGAIEVGQFTRMERNGPTIEGWGHRFSATEDALGFSALLDEAGRLGISVTVDDVDFEMATIPTTGAPVSGGPEPMLMPMGDLPTVITRARIIGGCQVALPAVDTAFIEPTSQDAAALIAAAIPVAPPVEWFANPMLDGATPMTIEDDGRVYGHLALWDTCHVGLHGCELAPREESMDYFLTGEVVCADGSRVPVGQITFNTGHASLGLDSAGTVAHYEHTGTAVMDVNCGPDAHGIWFAGALRPGVDAATIRALRGAKPSGDWRRIDHRLRLMAVLAVNVPGYPVVRGHVASGEQTALQTTGLIAPPAERPVSRGWTLIARHLAGGLR